MRMTAGPFALIAALSVLTLHSCSGEADFSDSMPEPVILSAEEYESEIREIDRLVFEEQPFADARKEALARRFNDLATRIRASSDSRFIFIEALEIKRLASVTKRFPATAPRNPLENEWMRIRNNVFDDRAWFARSAADLEAESEVAVVAVEKTPGQSPSFSPPKIVKSSSLNELEGRWAVKELLGNGRVIHDEETTGAVWEFGQDFLSIQKPSGTPTRYTVRKVEDERGTALRLESVSPPAENGWMIYKFDEGDLTVAFFDGLGGRPDDFTPPAGSGEPMFVVVRLSRVE